MNEGAFFGRSVAIIRASLTVLHPLFLLLRLLCFFLEPEFVSEAADGVVVFFACFCCGRVFEQTELPCFIPFEPEAVLIVGTSDAWTPLEQLFDAEAAEGDTAFRIGAHKADLRIVLPPSVLGALDRVLLIELRLATRQHHLRTLALFYFIAHAS